MGVAVASLLVLGTLVTVLTALTNGDSPAEGDFAVDVGVTPGAEEARLRARLQENPEDVNAMIVLADLLANTGRGNEAIQWFEKAVQQRPDDTDLRLAFARTLSRNNFRLDAELQLQRVLEQQPENTDALFLLGQLYEAWDPPRNEEARAAYQELLETAPESPYATQAQERLDALP